MRTLTRVANPDLFRTVYGMVEKMEMSLESLSQCSTGLFKMG